MIACLAVAASLTLIRDADAGARSTAAPGPLPATLAITTGSERIPQSFLGLSIEYNELAGYEDEGSVFDRVIALIRPNDGSRMILRIGGRSADRAYWQTFPTHAPKAAFEIGTPWLDRMRSLVARDHLRVMLDLNLAVHSPSLAVDFSRAVVKALPPSSVVGLEIGNEPDLYFRQPNLDDERVATTSAGTPVAWTRGYSPADYRRDFRNYARGLRASVPGIPLGGPEIALPNYPWLSAVKGLGPDGPQFVTIHRYASSSCWAKGTPNYPTIPYFLSEAASARWVGGLRGAAEFARQEHAGLQLTEVNSVSCSGNPEVAESFATALWAPDALFQLIRVGVGGVFWHTRPGTTNAPIHLTASGIQAAPELYGLALFADMTGRDAKILNSRLTVTRGLRLTAWVVQSRGRLSVMLINKGPRAADAALELGAVGIARVRFLRAPSPSATAGVSFGGQQIGSDARWHGHEVDPIVRGNGGVYQVRVPSYSAALVTAG